MTMRSLHAVRLRQGLLALKRRFKEDRDVCSFIDGLLDDLQKTTWSYEKWLDEAKMMAIRNPAFEGDFVGWLDDDFDDDEDGKDRPKPTGTV